MDHHYAYLKQQAEAKGLNAKISNEIDESDLKIVSDKNKLDTILKNLIENAIKYTEEGEIELGSKYSENTLNISIKDTGIGISEDRQRAIFDRFVQADISDRRVFEGLGIGLSIAKSYTEMLGGEISVESEEGVGSTFHITIHNKYEKEKPVTKPVEKPKHKESKEANKTLKILIAEDDEASYYFITIVLRNLDAKMLRAKKW
jgi:signal transduction histidine kinase